MVPVAKLGDAMKIRNTVKLTGLLVGASIFALPQIAAATEGYFQHGWGARHSALGGAGVADSRDATGQAINPAGLATLDSSQLNVAATLFSPKRKYTGSGAPSFSSNGVVDSDSTLFLVPNIAYNQRIDDVSGWGITVYGNGGMNTNYPAAARPSPDCPPVGGAGILCGGPLGVDLIQAFISVGYARQVGMISFGVAPILAAQRFSAKGLGAFAGFSSDPANLTNNGNDVSFGFGVKFGFQADLTDSFRLAAAFQTEINMGRFDKYAGLFADQGDFDIPKNFVIGFAFDFTEDITVMGDFKRIYYSDVGSVGNAGTIPLPFGATGGPGFGWDDISIFKVGAEWRQSDDFTWRLGFAHNDNPIGTNDVTLNILAPGVVQNHFSGGFSYTISDRSAIEVAATYVPTTSVTGPEQFNPAHLVTIEMKQFMFSLSWTYRFGL
jgi:long-chain fatty acid transport protein